MAARDGLGGPVRFGRTVWPSDLAPDHTDVRAADLTLSAVDESDLLAKVEVGGLGVINTLNLDQARFHISDFRPVFNIVRRV
jgi:hypothetical protein